MKFTKNWFYIVAVITFGLGVMLILWPALISGIFFDDLSTQAAFFARICGSTLVGYAALNWFSARANDIQVYRIAAWGNLVTLLIAAVISIIAASEFDYNRWLLAVQHTVFASGFTLVLHKLK